jgi:hypothetical protein
MTAKTQKSVPPTSQSQPDLATDLEARDVFKKAQKAVTREARDETFWKKLEEVTARVFKKVPIAPTGWAAKPKTPKQGLSRELNVIISDTHFGSDLDPRYVPHRFGTVEESRRLAQVVKRVCDYNRIVRKETRLRVHLAGDIFQNQLHDARDGDISAAQVARAIHLLTQAITIFASEFPEVLVDCATGNHGRNTGRHKERATYEKVDSLETMIYFAVKTAVKHLPNVNFEITRKPFVTFKSFDRSCFGTHGDTVLNPGWPSQNINAKSLEVQINRINASLNDAEEYKLFFCGHVHTGMVLYMGNGAVFITNGALIPSDQYSTSIGLFENQCGQMMWESTPEDLISSSHFIRVSPETDQDASLDRIIQPFRDF